MVGLVTLISISITYYAFLTALSVLGLEDLTIVSDTNIIYLAWFVYGQTASLVIFVYFFALLTTFALHGLEVRAFVTGIVLSLGLCVGLVYVYFAGDTDQNLWLMGIINLILGPLGILFHVSLVAVNIVY